MVKTMSQAKFLNGDPSSDDSVRLHGDVRTLRTRGLLEVDDLLTDDNLPELVGGNLEKLSTLDAVLSSESDESEPESDTQEPPKNHRKATVSRDRRQKTGKGIQQVSPVKGNKQKSAAKSIPQQRATLSEASSSTGVVHKPKSASTAEVQNSGRDIGAIEVNDGTGLGGGKKLTGRPKKSQVPKNTNNEHLTPQKTPW
ncbi:hypothetical protein BJV82DRAFT_712791 [Fennellomyces sp. T-0311]|nr:hypothetical protein BJV82DRAFT_712791 [Fennellomyces sp. T-0311]